MEAKEIEVMDAVAMGQEPPPSDSTDGQPDGAIPIEQLKPVPHTALTPMVMLSQAVQTGADVEVLERLVSLAERWKASEAATAFSVALSAMRDNLPILFKNKSVDYKSTHYKYEDLAGVVDQLAPVLAEHGLSFRWRTDTETPGTVKVTCILSHKDGHSEETTLGGPVDSSGSKNAIQAVGSAVTYLQRYTLKAAVGVAASADDDGRGGSAVGRGEAPAFDHPDPGTNYPPDQGQTVPEYDVELRITDAQRKLVLKLSKSHVWTEKEKADFENCAEWSMDRAKKGLDWMQTEIKKRKDAEPKPIKKLTLGRLRSATKGKNVEGVWELIGIEECKEPIDTMTEDQALACLEHLK